MFILLALYTYETSQLKSSDWCGIDCCDDVNDDHDDDVVI